MALPARTEPVIACPDAVIAGLFSTTGASHAVLVLAEIGLLRTVVPETVVIEVRRNLKETLPEALPAWEAFIKSAFVTVHRPHAADLRRNPVRPREGRSCHGGSARFRFNPARDAQHSALQPRQGSASSGRGS